MHPPDNPHDAAFEDQRRENLVLLALGEPVESWFDAHRRTCPQCQGDLSAYRDTVGLARESGNDRSLVDDLPPSAVWSGISRTLGFDEPSASDARSHPATLEPMTTARPRVIKPGSRWQRSRLGFVAAAAVVAVAAGIGVGAAIERDTRSQPPATQVLSQAQLNRAAGGPPSVSGGAKVHTSARGLALSIDTTGLPLRQGYYQVWLYDPVDRRMVPVGALGDDGRGTFNVPAGIDLRTYDVIDVSAQDYDGSYEHKQTVLQGPLTQ